MSCELYGYRKQEVVALGREGIQKFRICDHLDRLSHSVVSESYERRRQRQLHLYCPTLSMICVSQIQQRTSNPISLPR